MPGPRQDAPQRLANETGISVLSRRSYQAKILEAESELQTQLSLHYSPLRLLPSIPASLHHDAGWHVPHTSWKLGDSWRLQNAHFWSPQVGMLYTHYNKSPARYSGLVIAIIKGLCLISLVKKTKSCIQLHVRFRTLHLIFCTSAEILCFVFSGWQTAVSTQRNIFARRDHPRNHMQDWN